MSDIDKVTGQRIDYKEHNDNAPVSFSAPSPKYKQILKYYADEDCPKCGGTGYIGSFKNISGGRCFKCISDRYWENLLGELIYSGENYEIRYITTPTYDGSWFGIFEVELPPINEFYVYDSLEEALEVAKKKYGI